MKKHKKSKVDTLIMGLTIEEITQGWGSLEAFLEEQRRFGLYDIETHIISKMQKP